MSNFFGDHKIRFKIVSVMENNYFPSIHFVELKKSVVKRNLLEVFDLILHGSPFTLFYVQFLINWYSKQ